MHRLARVEEGQAEALGWAADFFRLAAQHPQAFSALYVTLKGQMVPDSAERGPNVIDLARARR